jgi:hypothetical protein
MATSNNNVIVSRIQNRRGLKQDLPSPLRAGEIGFATDSKQLYIGADTEIQAGAYNKVLVLENTTGAQDSIKSIANNQIIQFTVPHIRYSAGSFSGTEKTISYTPSTSKNYTLPNSGSDTRLVFRDSVVDGKIINLESNLAFKAQEITVTKNNSPLTGNNTASVANLSSEDYIFSSNTALANTHTVTFRNLLTATDEIGITYYGNSAVVQALDGYASSNSQITYHTSELNFYDQYAIPDYRKIDSKYIRISASTGVGHIGLQYKHISVVADSDANITFASLGNLLTSNCSDVVANVTATPSGSDVVIALDNSDEKFNASSYYNYVYVEDVDNSWVKDKAINLSASNATTISFSLPSANAWQTARPVTSTGTSGTVTLSGNVDGLSLNDNVVFTGANASYFDDGVPYTVTALTSSTFSVTESNVTVPITGNLDYINYGTSNTGAIVQLFSALHGHPNNSNISIVSSSDGSIAAGTFNVSNPITENTFFITPTSTVSANVSGTANVVFGSDTLCNVTPVRSINLSTATNLTEATAIVNGLADADAWESLQLVPDNSNRVYFTSKPAKSSIVFDYRLHNDSADTLNTLNILDDEYVYGSKKYDRQTTVKAKLEKWLNSTLVSNNINLFESVSTNQNYADSGVGSLESYAIDIDNEFNEMTFTSNEESENFAYILNNLYFETSSADIKGLLTSKLNIELLTSSGAASGQKTTSFDVTNTATIDSSNVFTSSDLPISTSTYDNHVLEYSVKYDGTSDGNYRRTGTIYLNSFENSVTGNSGVVIQDIASDYSDVPGTGNVSFNATYDSANNTITLTAQNTTNKDLTMNWVQRRWSS